MFSVPFTFDLFLFPRPRVFEHLALPENMAAHSAADCPPQWAARLDALCGHFPFASETDVLRMLTAAQGDTEVVAECLSEYPAARLFKPWCWPGAYDAYGLWRPVPQSEDPPAKFDWMAPDVYFDQDAPPSPGRTRSGRAYGSDKHHCLDPHETHLSPDEVDLHAQVVGVGLNGHPRRSVGVGWVPYTAAIAQVWPDAHPRRIQGEGRVWAQATWGW